MKITIGEQLQVEGPKGKLTVPIPAGHHASSRPNGTLEVAARERPACRAAWPDARAGGQRRTGRVDRVSRASCDIVGIGYRADVKGTIATFTLGYSHPIELLLPDGVDMKIDKQTHLVLTGHDRQAAGPGGGEYARAASSRIRTRTRASATPAKCCARRSARPASGRRVGK